MTTITSRIPDDLYKSLSEIAIQSERPKGYIIRKAIQNYIAELQEDLQDYKDAVEILSRNEPVVSWEEVQRKNGWLDN